MSQRRPPFSCSSAMRQAAALFLATSLTLPSPALALRQLNAGMEESPVNQKLRDRFGISAGAKEGQAAGAEEKLAPEVLALVADFRNQPKASDTLAILAARVPALGIPQRASFFTSLPWLAEREKVSQVVLDAFLENTLQAKVVREQIVDAIRGDNTVSVLTTLRTLLGRLSLSTEEARRLAGRIAHLVHRGGSYASGWEPGWKDPKRTFFIVAVQVGAAEAAIRTLQREDEGGATGASVYLQMALMHAELAKNFRIAAAKLSSMEGLEDRANAFSQIHLAVAMERRIPRHGESDVDSNTKALIDQLRREAPMSYHRISSKLSDKKKLMSPLDHLPDFFEPMIEAETAYAEYLSTRSDITGAKEHHRKAKELTRDMNAFSAQRRQALGIDTPPAAGMEEPPADRVGRFGQKMAQVLGQFYPRIQFDSITLMNGVPEEVGWARRYLSMAQMQFEVEDHTEAFELLRQAQDFLEKFLNVSSRQILVRNDTERKQKALLQEEKLPALIQELNRLMEELGADGYPRISTADKPFTAGMEEVLGQRVQVLAQVMERMDGFRSASLGSSVVVIGRSLANRYREPLEILAGLEERVLIDESPADTVVRIMELKEEVDAVWYLGRLEEAVAFDRFARPAQIAVTHRQVNPGDFKVQLQRIFTLLGVPQERLTAGLEEFTENLTALAPAA